MLLRRDPGDGGEPRIAARRSLPAAELPGRKAESDRKGEDHPVTALRNSSALLGRTAIVGIAANDGRIVRAIARAGTRHVLGRVGSISTLLSGIAVAALLVLLTLAILALILSVLALLALLLTILVLGILPLILALLVLGILALVLALLVLALPLGVLAELVLALVLIIVVRHHFLHGSSLGSGAAER
jgi:hypothetical protein